MAPWICPGLHTTPALGDSADLTTFTSFCLVRRRRRRTQLIWRFLWLIKQKQRAADAALARQSCVMETGGGWWAGGMSLMSQLIGYQDGWQVPLFTTLSDAD